MDSTKRSGYASLSQAFANFFRAQPTAGASPDEKLRRGQSKNPRIKEDEEEEEEEEDEVRRKAVDEALIAKAFASISSIKAAYSQIQFSESPFDAEGIQSSDEIIVSEMQNLSETKRSYYLTKYKSNDSPERALALSEIKEQKCLLKMHEISLKKLESELKVRDSEIFFLKDKLARLSQEKTSLERRLSSSGQLQISDNTQLNALNPTHFIAYSSRAMRSITAFARLLMSKMESAEWDMNAAADAIEPGISFQNQNHICYAFESFVCRVMLEGFNFPNFSIQTETKDHRLFFRSFLELKSARPEDYTGWKPKSEFATFCRKKYLKLIHRKMEASLFGNLSQRSLMSSNELPETPFLTSFVKMAKRVWLLHCLAFSFSPEVSVFRVSKGALFSEAYMESLNDEAFVSSSGLERVPRVAFTVVPGFEVVNTIIQCKVYLSIYLH